MNIIELPYMINPTNKEQYFYVCILGIKNYSIIILSFTMLT